jgi:Rps23 Pro-64 3,4-dihydroxylase Tpa1-like proline 4-hydroxylase
VSNNIIKTFGNFLSAEECDFILNKCKRELTLKEAEVYVDGSNNRYDKKIRKSSIGWISDLGFLNERLANKLRETFDINGMEVTGLGNFQFTEYKQGDEYNWHTDGDTTVHRDRFASIVIQLNEGYNGGILQIKNIKGELVPIENKIGTLYIFDSRLLHRVTPVETDVRYSLVNWISLVKTDSKKQNII